MNRSNDDELLRRFRAGDPAAFWEIWYLYYEALVAYFRRKFQLRPDDAEELVQEGFVRFVQSPPDRNVWTWLKTTITNLFHDQVRHKVVVKAHIANSRPISVSDATTPEQIVQDLEACDRVRMVVSQLTDTDREVIRLRDYEGKTFARLPRL